MNSIGGYPVFDRDLAKAVRILHASRPSVIGIDLFRNLPVEPGHASLVQVFREIPNIVGVEVDLNSDVILNVKPPPELPPERVGFADLIVDADGKLRRAILASRTLAGLKYSFALRLAQRYLTAHGIPFKHDRVSDPIQFGTVTLPRFQSYSGGYIRADASGNQVLLNFCANQTPFRILSLTAVLQQKFDPTWVRDRVVIIGMTASSIKDLFFTSALRETFSSLASKSQTSTNQLMYTVEVHAYTTNQIIRAVLNQQPFIQKWNGVWEYLWIVSWGLIGIVLSILLQSPWKSLLSIATLRYSDYHLLRIPHAWMVDSCRTNCTNLVGCWNYHGIF